MLIVPEFVTNAIESEEVVESMGLGNVSLVQKRPNESHLEDAAERFAEAVQPGGCERSRQHPGYADHLLIMIAGAVSISMAALPPSELENWDAAMNRECARYSLDAKRVAAVVQGEDPLADNPRQRRWWEAAIVLAATAIFVWLAIGRRAQRIYVNVSWMVVLMIGTLVPLILCGTLLWRRTRFS